MSAAQPDPAPPSPTGRPLATWQWWEAIGAFLVGYVAVAVVISPIAVLQRNGSISKNTADVLANILFDLVIMAVVVLWLRRFHPTWRRSVGFPSRLGPELVAGATVGLAYGGLAEFVLGPIVRSLLQSTTTHAVAPPHQIPVTVTGPSLLPWALFAIAIAPAFEEFFFRGVLFRTLRDRYGFAVGAIGSTLVFGLVHYTPAGPWQDSALLVIVVGIFGFLLAWLYERQGNLLANIAAHMAFNVVGFALILQAR